jgi:BolA protein
MKPSAEELKVIFEQAFGPQVTVVDDSHLHAGHAGAAGGGGHYTVSIVSERFAGLRTVQRHRLVYDVVSGWMPDRIHALSITAKLPQES